MPIMGLFKGSTTENVLWRFVAMVSPSFTVSKTVVSKTVVSKTVVSKTIVSKTVPNNRRQVLSWLNAGFVLLCLYAFQVGVAHANNLSVLVNGKSIHTHKNETTNYNESNYGFGLHYEFTKANKFTKTAQHWIPFMTVSGFKDSHNQPSYYAGGGYMRRLMLARKLNELHLDAGLIGFVMTREDYKSGTPFLGALPALSLGTRDVSVNVTYIPKVHPKMAELWFFQLKLSTRSIKY